MFEKIIDNGYILQQKMHYKLFYFLFVCICFAYPNLGKAQGVTIKIHNKTGIDLDSVAMGSVYFGSIPNDSMKIISGMTELVLQSNLPLFQPTALVKGQRIGRMTSKCGTKSKVVKSGSFALDLMLYEQGEDVRLYWKEHQ